MREDLKVLISECYRNEALDPRLENDEFDIIGPDGVIILPRIWPLIVQSGLEVTIRMWPSSSSIHPNVEARERHVRNQRNAERELDLERDREDIMERHRRLERELATEREERKQKERRLEQELDREREERRQNERRLEQELDREREERRSRDRNGDLGGERQDEEPRQRDRGLERARPSTRQNIQGIDRPFSRLHSCLLWFAGCEKSTCD